MIKTVFFDFDGVLTTDFNGSGNICRNLCFAIPGLSLQKVTDCYRKHCGRLLVEPVFYSEVWDEFCACAGEKISDEVMEKAVRTVSRNEETFELVQNLRRRYTIGMITDNSIERMNLVSADMHLSDSFDPMVISASVCALKHDGTTTIFDAALKAADSQPSESIFIDNQERNLVTPSRMGIKTCWHDAAKNDIPALISALQTYGVEIEQ